jgi:hypothetical protein
MDPSDIGIGSAAPTGHKRHGLRRLSPDLISKAIDETNAQVIRIGLTFLGTAAFCFLSLFSPDSVLLLGGVEKKVNVPFAGPVSFLGFLVVGPIVLILLRVYLQIYVEHSDRLERLRRSLLPVRAPTLVPFKNPLIRILGGVTFYLMLPIAMMVFVWKAAVLPIWGSGLLCVAVGVVASHWMLAARKDHVIAALFKESQRLRPVVSIPYVYWRSNALLSVGAAIVALPLILVIGPPHRKFDLQGLNLAHQPLHGVDFSRADLSYADLSYADLRGANLTRAQLDRANLTGANLTGAKLNNAALYVADLRGANLTRANLTDASLYSADLTGAILTDVDLRKADNIMFGIILTDVCGNENTKLPEGFGKAKPCP